MFGVVPVLLLPVFAVVCCPLACCYVVIAFTLSSGPVGLVEMRANSIGCVVFVPAGTCSKTGALLVDEVSSGGECWEVKEPRNIVDFQLQVQKGGITKHATFQGQLQNVGQLQRKMEAG